jgi:16S rRNA (cytidine1402-2'-O)-methyltransferase
MGTFYLVGTPIGNLEDISPNAIAVLRSVDLIASENPTRTQRLLARYEISTPMRLYTDAYDRKKHTRRQSILTALETGDVALVSEAGMPGLADPGFELLAAIRRAGHPIVPIPGPTALTTALSVAGIQGEGFIFLGFLPRGKSARRARLAEHADGPWALVAYESPHRLLSTLSDLTSLYGERPMVVAGELTKLYEEIQRGRATQLLDYFDAHPPRGEFTLVIAPPLDVSDTEV